MYIRKYNKEPITKKTLMKKQTMKKYTIAVYDAAESRIDIDNGIVNCFEEIVVSAVCKADALMSAIAIYDKSQMELQFIIR